MTRPITRRTPLATIAALLVGTACTGTALADKSDFPEYDDKKAGEFKETKSGLKYRVIKPGDESKKPLATDTVVAHYHGTLESGKKFDSSYDRGAPIPFPLNRVIKGWTEGLQLIGEGGMVQLIIPSDLAYGNSPPPGSGIKAGDTLYFNVELVEVK